MSFARPRLPARENALFSRRIAISGGGSHAGPGILDAPPPPACVPRKDIKSRVVSVVFRWSSPVWLFVVCRLSTASSACPVSAPCRRCRFCLRRLRCLGVWRSWPSGRSLALRYLSCVLRCSVDRRLSCRSSVYPGLFPVSPGVRSVHTVQCWVFECSKVFIQGFGSEETEARGF